MTICIAAIGTLPNNDRAIVGISDWMLTAGDIQYEPPRQPKAYAVTPHSIVFMAGDMATQITVCDWVASAVRRTPTTNIEAIANHYGACYRGYRNREAERAILSPVGLGFDSFHAAQRTLAPEWNQQITAELRNYALDAEAIVCGVDDSGPHIFTVQDPGVVRCADAVGFASIGSGARHADSQFMLAQYTKSWPIAHTFWLAYSAKRRAEVAPGVGKGNDLLFIERNGWVWVMDEIRDALGSIYDEAQAAEQAVAEKARTRVGEFIGNILNPPPPQVTGVVQEAAPGP